MQSLWSARIERTSQPRERRQRRNGFTFVEILVAMLVFGALTAISVPRYREFKERAYLSILRSQLGEIRTAQEAYWAEQTMYTTTLTDLDWKLSSEVTIAINAADLLSGYTATATHLLAPGLACSTAVGSEALTSPSGEIVCGPAVGGPGPGVAPAT